MFEENILLVRVACLRYLHHVVGVAVQMLRIVANYLDGFVYHVLVEICLLEESKKR